MSSVSNIVLQVGINDEPLINKLDALTLRERVGSMAKIDSEVCGGPKKLEVEVYLMTLNGRKDVADVMASIVEDYQDGDGEVVLLLTHEAETTQVIRPKVRIGE